jgi:hypothetical protein
MPPTAPIAPLTPTKITSDQVQDALRRSGYLVEYRVEQIVGRRGFYTEANQAYPDPLTGKSRELDLAAMSAHSIGPGDRHWLFSQLLIECVNNPQPMAFFTKTPVAPSAHLYDIVFSGLPMKVRSRSRGGWVHLADFLDAEKYHHYCRGRIATQYCSFSPKKSSGGREWTALHDDEHFDSFHKLCHALNHGVDDHLSRWHMLRNEHINLQLYYLILVVSGELLEVRPRRRALEILGVNRIHFIQSFVSAGGERRYHIDVVTEGYVPKLLTRIEKELWSTAEALAMHRREIQRSIDTIAASVLRVRSPSARRERLENPG